MRVANYDKNILYSFTEMLFAAGLSNPSKIQRKYILRRLDPYKMATYRELYP